MRESVLVFATLRPVASALVAGLVLASASVAEAAALSGRARVLDGDTLEIEGTRVRLEGIDAPEAGQTCGKGFFGTWSCGSVATNTLENLVKDQKVDCESRGRDKYGRMLGICQAAGRELNAEMVRSGNAWAFVKYSQAYVTVEAEARAAKAGIWKSDAEPAWVYREKRWTGAEQQAPEGCAIKGNISAKGRLYHMPWSPWYNRVSIDAAKGERWFCSETDAAAAGWKPAASN